MNLYVFIPSDLIDDKMSDEDLLLNVAGLLNEAFTSSNPEEGRIVVKYDEHETIGEHLIGLNCHLFGCSSWFANHFMWPHKFCTKLVFWHEDRKIARESTNRNRE